MLVQGAVYRGGSTNFQRGGGGGGGRYFFNFAGDSGAENFTLKYLKNTFLIF